MEPSTFKSEYVEGVSKKELKEEEKEVGMQERPAASYPQPEATGNRSLRAVGNFEEPVASWCLFPVTFTLLVALHDWVPATAVAREQQSPVTTDILAL